MPSSRSAGAVERLRDLRDPPPDAPRTSWCWARPTPPSPTARPSPGRAARAGRAPSRVFGAAVVLVDGRPVIYLERGGRGLLTFPTTDERALSAAVETLAAWVLGDRRRRAGIERVDGAPVFGSPLEAPLAAAGFRNDLRGMVLRA